MQWPSTCTSALTDIYQHDNIIVFIISVTTMEHCTEWWRHIGHEACNKAWSPWNVRCLIRLSRMFVPILFSNNSNTPFKLSSDALIGCCQHKKIRLINFKYLNEFNFWKYWTNCAQLRATLAFRIVFCASIIEFALRWTQDCHFVLSMSKNSCRLYYL